MMKQRFKEMLAGIAMGIVISLIVTALRSCR